MSENNSSIDKAVAAEKLWRLGLVSWKFHDTQVDIYEAVNKFIGSTFVINCSRQIGKCRFKSTTCMTPNGPVEMQYIKPGDQVYGYNPDGSISLTTVLASESQGEKEVVDFTHNGKVIETATKEHRWLTKAVTGTKWLHLKDKVRETKNFYKGVLIRREFINVPCGTVNEPHAYAIGALLGDGCSRESSDTISISSEDGIIPYKVGNILNVEFVHKNSEKNYTWKLSHVMKRTGSGYNIKAPKVYCNYYDEWCKGRYAHEKIADWDVINTWDRESCLNFVSGLIDTDGNVMVKNNILIIQISMQAKPVIDVLKKLFFKLWQYDPNIVIDNRSKYKNGPCYGVRLSNNLFSKRALKELSPYLSLERKQWKPEYENCLENNSNKNYIGVKMSAPYKAECWDIQVDNETSLYLTGHGLVTHNSFMLCGYAIEYAMQHKGAKICYLAPTAKAVKKIIIPRIREILSDCPRDILPDYKVNEQVYNFKNGSEIHIAGTDAERAENLRGQVFHLVICDEAGFMDKLDYVLSSILRPLTITVNGKIILSSTPPVSPAHPFKKIAEKAKMDGAYIKKTIYDNPLISDKVRDQYMKEAGGEDSVAWKREFLAEFIIDENEAVIPEANEAKMKELVKDIVPYNPGQQLNADQIMKPGFFDAYTVADLGYTDNTGILFGYWDWYGAYLVIEDEAMFNKPNTQMISNIVTQKENALWNGKKPYQRFCDGDLITISDLNSQHGLGFSQTRKDELETSVNAVRLFVQDNKIRIHPRCVNLISQLQSATWDSTRKKFSRSVDHGHFDLIAALIYMVRNIQRNRNPYPAGLGLDIASMYVPSDSFKEKKHSNLEKLVSAPMDRFFPNTKDKKD